MDDEHLLAVYATLALIVGTLVVSLVRRRFDPFAPIWLFLVGYVQIYIVQPISYQEYALRARGHDLTMAAALRAFWALAWFLAVYYSGLGRWLAARLPAAPRTWSRPLIYSLAPALVAWGLLCARIPENPEELSPEGSLLRSFPIVMLAAGALLIVSARSTENGRASVNWAVLAAGVGVATAYVLLWMFNGKRSHSLFGVLVGVSAYYLSRGKRPSWPVLGGVAALGVLAVSLALGWRNDFRHERSFDGFIQYLQEFDPTRILIDLNLKDRYEAPKGPYEITKETEEYGGTLLMMDTVPEKADYDYGASYLRVFSTYIPRIIWKEKPIYGRQQWVDAWIAGSEFKREASFTGPAISILGATQLNGGATATAIVLGLLALMLRGGYEYFRLYADRPWAQAWWSLTFFNAWLMVVNDDPMVWYYYVYGHTIMPLMAFLWIYHKVNES